MGSVDPIDIARPLPFAKTEQTALEKMFDACAGDVACHAAFPDLREEFRQMSARLSSGSVRVTVQGQTGDVPLDRGRVAEWFRSKLYRPYSSTTLAWMIHRAFLGDWKPISEGILSDASDASPFSFGLFFAITCSEDIPFIREDEVARETEGTFLGDYRVREQQAACKYWPGPHSRKTIANVCGHRCRPCSSPVIPMALRRYGSWSMLPRVSRIA